MAVIASMNTFAAPPSALTLAPLGVFTPQTPLVVKRDKRRRRRNQNDANDATEKRHHSKRRAVRQGFVFDTTVIEDVDRSTLASAAPSSAPSATGSTFVFRVRKTPVPAVDAEHASEALRKKQERAKHLEQKRQRLQKRKAAMEKEEQIEAALMEGDHALSRDQLALYHAVRDQVKREMRKTMRDFARSAARADILQLTETSLDAIKSGVAEFLTQNPPSQSVVTVSNPENARLKALIASYESRIKELEAEETKWTTMKDSLAAVTHTSEGEEAEKKEVVLSVTTEIGNLQRAAIAQVETSAQLLLVIQDSMKSVDRLALQAEIRKTKLFDAFHGSAFKGYAQDPKETLRALLKLAPRSSTH